MKGTWEICRFKNIQAKLQAIELAARNWDKRQLEGGFLGTELMSNTDLKLLLLRNLNLIGFLCRAIYA